MTIRRVAHHIVVGSTCWLSVAAAASAQVLNRQALLEAQTFWDNRDWDWYQRNIPFFESPDAELNTTYYYRWELLTKHLTYGSPNSGYSFTEFIDRPFWSGAYGAISCPAGHQLYEARWLWDSRYVWDYARYWFRTPGAQPRRYGCWLADGIWAAHAVQPDDGLLKELLPDLQRNYEGWEKRQFVPEVGLFWQNGHDDGMEYNITSRQTADIVRGGDGFRPGFNAYMYADALAIARVARLAGDAGVARQFDAKAAALKEKVQALLWDPKREFFFPMSMRDETDAEGNMVKRHTLTYQSGKFAGDPHGREEHGYIPWQFSLPDRGYEAAWKFLMDPNYFYAEFGPTTVERQDPLFRLEKRCCWWSGQSWPYATAQTLKAMANLLQAYEQSLVTRADYNRLLRIFARSHRRAGRPYLAEALHPDTGSFEGHDSPHHSEHYFHSSFNDLIITGLLGLQPRADDRLVLEPLAPLAWPFFAMENIPYHGHSLSVYWDHDGARYGRGPGFRLLVDGKLLASSNRLGRLEAACPARLNSTAPPAGRARLNYAVNNDGLPFPRLTASFTNATTPLRLVNDGNYWYHQDPPNRWTTLGSTNASDWLEVDFGVGRRIDQVMLYFLDDGANVVAPHSFIVEVWDGQHWKAADAEKRSPDRPLGHRANSVRLQPVETRKLRLTFQHAARAATGLSEVEAWGEGALPYVPPQ
jgi:hypothetical protein